jgi:hypothetical protein
MGYTDDLLTGLAEHLATAGIGTWRADDTAYVAGETAIIIRGIPQTPDRLITLAPYPVDSSAFRGLADHQLAVQARVRGTQDPRVCDSIADAIYDLLDSVTRLTLGGIAVVQIWRQSYTSLGQDSNGRWEASHNYYLDTMRPTAHNTD